MSTMSINTEPVEIPPDVILSNPGDGWQGSFGIALEAFVSDILSDGAPFLASITWVLDNGDEMEEQHWIEGLRDGQIIPRRGEPIPTADVKELRA